MSGRMAAERVCKVRILMRELVTCVKLVGGSEVIALSTGVMNEL